MDRVIGEIYVTKNYDMFSFMESNRSIITNKKLEESVLRGSIIMPIMVNSNLQIIDGQHRLMLAKKHNMDVPYFITINKQMSDVVVINNTTQKWKVLDFINRHAETGNLEYKRLKKIINRHPAIPLVELISVSMGSWNKSQKLVNQTKEGKFKFYNYEEFLLFIEEYEQLKKDTKIKDSGALFQAYFNLCCIKIYDYKTFFKKVNELEIERKILGIRQTERILKIFIETYHHNLGINSKKRISYDLDLKRYPVIKGEINYTRVDPRTK